VNRLLAAAAAVLSLAAGPACAEVDLFARESFVGRLDLRFAASDGEPSWLDGGFGKTRFGGDRSGDYKLRAKVAEASIEWKPRFNWEWQAVIGAQIQHGQDRDIDLGEAYLQYKPVPRGETRVSSRAGLYYPLISMEHDAPIWSVSRTITPSAINSWIGEEVKVVGIEGTVMRPLGNGEVEATAGLFDFDDTSGTLLAFRGWSLSDVKNSPQGSLPLPPLSPFMRTRQAAETYPGWRLDKRLGWYARLEWRPNGRWSVNAFHYDNVGNKRAVREQQWSWATRFTNLGAVFNPDARTKIMGQVMWGQTLMGFTRPGTGIWVDVGFKSAYLLASRTYGKAAITGRVDWFATHDTAARAYGDNSEEGWAATAAYRYTVSPHVELVTEVLHVQSDRPSRVLARLSAEQSQTALQTALRLTF
jgi:hypothetical protein